MVVLVESLVRMRSYRGLRRVSAWVGVILTWQERTC